MRSRARPRSTAVTSSGRPASSSRRLRASSRCSSCSRTCTGPSRRSSTSSSTSSAGAPAPRSRSSASHARSCSTHAPRGRPTRWRCDRSPTTRPRSSWRRSPKHSRSTTTRAPRSSAAAEGNPLFLEQLAAHALDGSGRRRSSSRVARIPAREPPRQPASRRARGARARVDRRPRVHARCGRRARRRTTRPGLGDRAAGARPTAPRTTRHASVQSDDAFLFDHALIRDATYAADRQVRARSAPRATGALARPARRARRGRRLPLRAGDAQPARGRRRACVAGECRRGASRSRRHARVVERSILAPRRAADRSCDRAPAPDRSRATRAGVLPGRASTRRSGENTVRGQHSRGGGRASARHRRTLGSSCGRRSSWCGRACSTARWARPRRARSSTTRSLASTRQATRTALRGPRKRTALLLGAFGDRNDAALVRYERGATRVSGGRLAGREELTAGGRARGRGEHARPRGAGSLQRQSIVRRRAHPRELAFLQAYLAWLLALNDDLDGARHVADDARRALSEFGEDVALQTYVGGHARIDRGVGRRLARGGERSSRMRSTSARERRSGERGAAQFLSLLGEVALGKLEFAAALEYAEEARRLSPESDIHVAVQWRRVAARALAGDGHPERALPLAEEAVAIADTTDDLVVRGGARVDLAEVQLRRWREGTGRAYARRRSCPSGSKGSETARVSRARQRLASLLEGRRRRGADVSGPRRSRTQQLGGQMLPGISRGLVRGDDGVGHRRADGEGRDDRDDRPKLR